MNDNSSTDKINATVKTLSDQILPVNSFTGDKITQLLVLRLISSWMNAFMGGTLFTLL